MTPVKTALSEGVVPVVVPVDAKAVEKAQAAASKTK